MPSPLIASDLAPAVAHAPRRRHLFDLAEICSVPLSAGLCCELSAVCDCLCDCDRPGLDHDLSSRKEAGARP